MITRCRRCIYWMSAEKMAVWIRSRSYGLIRPALLCCFSLSPSVRFLASRSRISYSQLPIGTNRLGEVLAVHSPLFLVVLSARQWDGCVRRVLAGDYRRTSKAAITLVVRCQIHADRCLLTSRTFVLRLELSRSSADDSFWVRPDYIKRGWICEPRLCCCCQQRCRWRDILRVSHSTHQFKIRRQTLPFLCYPFYFAFRFSLTLFKS